MDSGNSGSLQSSSGGEEELDSRGGGGFDSLSAVLRRPTLSVPGGAAFSVHGSLYGLPEFTSALPQQQQAAPWSTQFVAVDPGTHQQGADPSGTAVAAPPPRGSRKRARASRRAPTTVLTTDTSNFRAMVQEFTGIPSPPFAGGPPAGSFHSRFDHLFPSPSTLRSAAAGDPASSMPPYLLRPFAHKLQTTPSPFPPFTSPSSSTPPSSSNITVANANVTDSGTTTASAANQRIAGDDDDFQLPSPALLHDSYLSFQSLLGSTQSMFGGFSHAAPRLHQQSPSPFLSGVGGGGGRTIGFNHSGLMVSEEGMHDVHLGGGGDELSGVVASGSGGGKLNYTSQAGASSSSAAASTDRPPDGIASRPKTPP